MNVMIFKALLPLIIMGAGIVVLMLQIAIRRHHVATFYVGIAVIVLSLAAVAGLSPTTTLDATPLLIVDNFARLFSLLILLAALVTLMASDQWLRFEGAESGEYTLLILLATFGAMVLVHAQHAAAFILGLEILGVSVYTLIAYPQRQAVSVEAGLKYLVLSSASTAILLFGVALIYAATGTLDFQQMGAGVAGANNILISCAAILILAGVGFKLSLVPFHMWTPDIYEGAPTPVTGFLATVSKVAIFASLLRWYTDARLGEYEAVLVALTFVAILSMVMGNLLALKQDNVKRLLGYSSVAHMGYLLITVIIFTAPGVADLAREASVWYLIAYTVSTLAAFVALTMVADRGACPDSTHREKLQGLFWRQPLVATLLTVALLSLAGVPLTAGFIGKFYVVAAGVDAQAWSLLVALVLGSAISIFYYLRTIYSFTGHAELDGGGAVAMTLMSKTLAVILIIGVLLLGTMPNQLIDQFSWIL